jgi:hypothetical protein
MDMQTGLEVREMLRSLVDKVVADIPRKKLDIYYKGKKVKYSLRGEKIIRFD